MRAFAVLLLCAWPLAVGAAQSEAVPRALSLEVVTRSWEGDFDAMRERRLIRVLVPYSRSLFYYDAGRPRGLTADLVHDFEAWLNRRYAKTLGNRPISVVPIPVTRDKLIPWIVAGRGDIAAGNLTITTEREKLVDFSHVGLSGVFEVVNMVMILKFSYSAGLNSIIRSSRVRLATVALGNFMGRATPEVSGKRPGSGRPRSDRSD